MKLLSRNRPVGVLIMLFPSSGMAYLLFEPILQQAHTQSKCCLCNTDRSPGTASSRMENFAKDHKWQKDDSASEASWVTQINN